MSAVTKALVRRAADAASPNLSAVKPSPEFNYTGIFIIGATFVAFLAVISLITYTLTMVLTLTAVEDTTEQYVPIPTVTVADDDDLDFKSFKDIDSENSAPLPAGRLPSGPVTSTIRSTLIHLRRQAGGLSAFRGFAPYLITQYAAAAVAGLVIWLLPSFVPDRNSVASVFAALLFARLSMAWTHIVISRPSNLRWYRRLPPRSTWRKIAPAAFVYSVAEQVTYMLPMVLAKRLGLCASNSDIEPKTYVMRFLVVLGVFLGIAFLILIPAFVTLVRVQASLLPEETEPIVPLDRTFSGRVVPEVEGGSGVLGLIDAWKSFGWSSRIRLVKLYAKVAGIYTVLFGLFAVVLTGELMFFEGERLGLLITKLRGDV